MAMLEKCSCGGEAELWRTRKTWTDRDIVWVQCQACGRQTLHYVIFNNEQAAIDEWNRTRKQEREEYETAFFKTLLAMVDDATYAQLKELIKYVNKRLNVKCYEHFQADMAKLMDEKEKKND